MSSLLSGRDVLDKGYDAGSASGSIPLVILPSDVQCSGDVTLGKTARVTGNIQAATITMEKGCSVKGNITVS